MYRRLRWSLNMCVCVWRRYKGNAGEADGEQDGTITVQELRVAEVYFRSPFLWDLMLHHWAMGAQHFEAG